MTIENFIKENSEKIDSLIVENTGNRAELFNDDERRLMVLNNPELYKMAIAAGVQIK